MNNVEKIEVIKSEYDSFFEEVNFNEFVSTTSKKDFRMLCNKSIVQDLDADTLKEFVISLKNKNDIIVEYNDLCNNAIDKYSDEVIVDKLIRLKNQYKTKEDVLLNFEKDFTDLSLSISNYNEAKSTCENLTYIINNFNRFCHINHSIKLSEHNLNIIYDDYNSYAEIKIFASKVENYIYILKKLKDMSDKKQFTPHINTYDGTKKYWRNLYLNTTFHSYSEDVFFKFTKDEEKLDQIIVFHGEFEKTADEIKDLKNNIKLRFESNRILTNIFYEELSQIDKKYKKIRKEYFDESIEFDIVMYNMFGIKRKLHKLDDNYNHVLSPVKNTLNMLQIEDQEEINDIEDYYIYSISKVIERTYNLYGSSKNITEDEVNDLIDIVQEKLYVLTNDQKKAVLESVDMLNNDYTANCLIQGDVSSGKTIIIIILMFLIAQRKMKSVYIVPRRVLRRQHLNTLRKYNDKFNLGLKIYDVEEKFDIQDADIILNGYSFNNPIFDEVEFSLGVIDEIQLFGVQQRNQVQKKFPNIDMFYTTATPHPRTKLLTLIGNLDIIEIKEKPPGRKQCSTEIFEVLSEDHQEVIRKEAINGNMTLIVCPLINVEGITPYESLYTAFEKYKEMFPDLNVEHLSTKLKESERDDIVQRSIDGEIDILVATKSIEVGIDIPRASVMIIHYPHERSVKWGVSQLHQLRGRVGRNNQDAFCFIEVPNRLTVTNAIRSVLNTTDVFELTRNDFDWRGFEKIIGTRQSGKSTDSKKMKKRIEAYEMVALTSKKRFQEMDKEFILKLDEALRTNRVENLN